MKKVEIENMLNSINNISQITNKENYNLSSAVNKELSQIIPILKAEYNRMDNDKLEINCPALFVVTEEKVLESDTNDVTLFINNKIKELVMNEYKIIDFGLCHFPVEGVNILGYIKYTS